MILQGSILIDAPVWNLWHALLDETTLLACVPGAESVDRIDDNVYRCVARQKVGPISLTFRLDNVLTAVEPPSRLEVTGKGRDLASAGRLSHDTSVDLRTTKAGAVEITYRCNVRLLGRLAGLGDRLIKAKARELEQQFAAALQRELSAAAGPAAEA